MRQKDIFAGLCLALLLLAAAPVVADGGIIRDAEIEQSLKTFAQPVLEQAGLSPGTVRFVMIEDNDLNAFVAGGQNIFLNTGLLLATENAAELTGVIAHEAGHISGGHLFRTREEIENLSLQAMLANILGVAAAIGAQSADVGLAVGAAGSSYLQRSLLRHSRVQETSADQAGVRFLEGAQLPVTGFLSFMKKLANQELLPENQQSPYVRTHPLAADRIDFLQHTADEGAIRAFLPPPGWDALHRRMKAKLSGYLFPDRALQSKEISSDADYARAIAFYRKGKTKESLALMDSLIKGEPRNPYFYEQKGQILFESGRISESLMVYAAAARYAPQSGLIRMAYGHALLESGGDNMDEAVRQLTLALETEPRQPQIHHFLAIAYGKKGEEGLSRLHLAEEALLQNKNDFAKREAGLAIAALPKGSPSVQRARDILDLATRNGKKKEKH